MAAILQRILRDVQHPNLFEVLAERLSLSDLQSLLLAVYQRRAARLSPADVLRQYRRNRFVRLAQIAPQAALEFDRLAFSLLPPGFEAVELSPVSPLGACSVLGTVNQNNVVATVRNTEVCADSTNLLALECAVRRKPADKRCEDIKLCASQRLLRGQLFQGPAVTSHFRVFSLCTAGSDRGRNAFEIEALHDQIDFYVRLLEAAHQLDCSVQEIRVTLTPFAGGDASLLGQTVLPKLAAAHSDVDFSLDLDRQAGYGYYQWAAFQIRAQAPGGKSFSLVDGGFTDWTQKLVASRKERLLVSGIGVDRFLLFFKSSQPPVTADVK